MAFLEGSRDRWIKHYSSFHRILLVGEGDFSFSLCLAVFLGSGSNIIATSLDSYDLLIRKYARASWNLHQLQSYGATLIFGVDATKMYYSTADLANRRFDRIVFNFPHAGFYGREDNPQLIKMHRELVEGFFHNAVEMLQPNGEVHVSHKTTPPFCDWNIVELALRNHLTLLDCVDFNTNDYPGYDNKRGDSYKADDPFPLGQCCTYKFVINPMINRMNHDMIQRNTRNDSSNLEWLSFHICGLTRVLGLAGCGGVLIDTNGVYRFVFSAPLGVCENEVAELCAFKAALCRFLRSKFGNRSVVIRSNSYLAVSWINNPNVRPMHLLKHFNEIDAMLYATSNVRVQLIDREDNHFAEILAEKSICCGFSEVEL